MYHYSVLYIYKIIYRIFFLLDFESNFDIASEAISDLQGIPYDYGSVMHYSAYAFAVDRRTPTITPIDSSVSLSALGQRGGFSSSDITHARLLYCSNTITMGEHQVVYKLKPYVYQAISY